MPRPLEGPDPYHTYNGLATVAVVPSTCGLGCSQQGRTGIELQQSLFDTLYEGVHDDGQYDQTLFYEFGRNFGFYGDKIAYKTPDEDPITTGYAVFMRFMAMDAVGVSPPPGGSGLLMNSRMASGACAAPT